MGRRPTCLCGECDLCKRRKAQQKWQAKRKKKQYDGPIPVYRDPEIVETTRCQKREIIENLNKSSRERRKERKLQEILSSNDPISSQKGSPLPIALMLRDFTRLGLDVDVCRDGRCIRISISLPERDANIQRIPMNAIKVLEIKNEGVTVVG